MKRPTTATTTQTATDRTVPGSSSAGAAPVKVAGETGKLSEAMSVVAASGDTGLPAPEEGVTKSEPAPSVTMVVGRAEDDGTAQVKAVLRLTTGVVLYSQSDQTWVDVAVGSTDSEVVVLAQSLQVYSADVVLVLAGSTGLLVVVHSAECQ